MANGNEKGLQFGDGVSTTRVKTVTNQYGPRDSVGGIGVVKTEGSHNELKVDFSWEELSAGALDLENFVLPAGAVPTRAFLEVDEAFTLGGTTPTILIGTQGSEVTNGFVASEAQAEAAATYDLTSTLTGTWAAPLAAATTVDIALGGTSPTATVGGRAQAVVQYVIV